MKRRSTDVTAATNFKNMPPTHNINGRGQVREQSPTPARRPPITPPTQASGFGETGIHSRATYEAIPSRPAYTLPEKVTARQVQQESFKYGGGRSAGNRSLAENMMRKVYEP